MRAADESTLSRYLRIGIGPGSHARSYARLAMNEPVKGPAVPRRSVRDWIVDTLLFLIAAALTVYVAGERIDAGKVNPAWLFVGDQLLGVLACLSLWLRRRWPVQLAAVLLGLSAVSEMVGGPSAIALFTVAVHCSLRVTGVVFALGLATTAVYAWLRPDPNLGFSGYMALTGVLITALVGWGLFIQHRRQLVVSLKERAVRAEAEAHLRAEQAQLRAREDIAREIHDVLGHRLSLLSVHAGALAYRPDAPSQDIARAAEIIRESAHNALQDLREVVGVLRAPVGELLPQPTLGDVATLVAESVRAGTAVALRQEVAEPVPDSAGRTVYRIVQECLTNARKHAPGAAVDVRIAGDPDRGLTVEVGNGTPAAGPAPTVVPGQGLGLAGLAERVGLAGGRMEHGATGAGGWRVTAWLPWPA